MVNNDDYGKIVFAVDNFTYNRSNCKKVFSDWAAIDKKLNQCSFLSFRLTEINLIVLGVRHLQWNVILWSP
uniref:Uncharacterized protein n=1 Tax=Magnetococcus massalia (strain MO-1) TaxID=451514 RepID=A0A1S7LLP2_MAGMO|nr:protein of unknown function [Candidatus Magnetococcus massalia]